MALHGKQNINKQKLILLHLKPLSFTKAVEI
jgi:hypothetical protein